MESICRQLIGVGVQLPYTVVGRHGWGICDDKRISRNLAYVCADYHVCGEYHELFGGGGSLVLQSSLDGSSGQWGEDLLVTLTAERRGLSYIYATRVTYPDWDVYQPMGGKGNEAKGS